MCIKLEINQGYKFWCPGCHEFYPVLHNPHMIQTIPFTALPCYFRLWQLCNIGLAWISSSFLKTSCMFHITLLYWNVDFNVINQEDSNWVWKQTASDTKTNDLYQCCSKMVVHLRLQCRTLGTNTINTQ